MNNSELYDKYGNFKEEARTFETRLLFIKEIFEKKYPRSDIMAKCIQYKLEKSFKAYVKTMDNNIWNLYNKDPMAILKKLNK